MFASGRLSAFHEDARFGVVRNRPVPASPQRASTNLLSPGGSKPATLLGPSKPGLPPAGSTGVVGHGLAGTPARPKASTPILRCRRASCGRVDPTRPIGARNSRVSTPGCACKFSHVARRVGGRTSPRRDANRCSASGYSLKTEARFLTIRPETWPDAGDDLDERNVFRGRTCPRYGTAMV